MKNRDVTCDYIAGFKYWGNHPKDFVRVGVANYAARMGLQKHARVVCDYRDKKCMPANDVPSLLQSNLLEMK